MNRGLDEIGGAVLAVSQFTLAASIRKGRRPSFDRALAGDAAEPLFDRFLELLRAEGVTVETGVFGALMDVELVNDGPVTLIWEDAPRGNSEPGKRFSLRRAWCHPSHCLNSSHLILAAPLGQTMRRVACAEQSSGKGEEMT